MKHVMITEHDFELFQVAKDALEPYYMISPFPKETNLLEFQQNQVDLLLITMSASDTEGFQTCAKLMKIPELIGKPVIFFAKHGSEPLEQRALSLGAYDFITAPISFELFLHRIGNCLELVALRKEKPYMERYQDAISFSLAELLECRDITTGGHLKNTQMYFNVLLGEALESDTYKEKIPFEDRRDLLRSVMLHDIGKIGINDEVLRKSSSLNYNEFEYMKTHTTLGKQTFEKIIRETGGTRWLYLAKDMAYCHHERWDGTGYPNGLKGEEIPLYARMLTIVDVYDALTSNRAYKKAYSHEKATKMILEGKGRFFDPELVDLFMKVNKQFEELLNLINERE